MNEVSTGGLAIIVFSKCCGLKAVGYWSFPPLHKLQPVKEQRTIQGVKRKGRNRRERYEKKKFKIVMEELAIMNPFLIPLWHMLVLIP